MTELTEEEGDSVLCYKNVDDMINAVSLLLVLLVCRTGIGLHESAVGFLFLPFNSLFAHLALLPLRRWAQTQAAVSGDTESLSVSQTQTSQNPVLCSELRHVSRFLSAAKNRNNQFIDRREALNWARRGSRLLVKVAHVSRRLVPHPVLTLSPRGRGVRCKLWEK